MKDRVGGAWRAIPWLFLACAACFLLLVNVGDWDYFLTALEVDRRAWILDHELPLWSYQLCGGVTRIGDPQSYGLSPLFAPVLAFGSLWGGKLLVLGLWVLGYHYLRCLLRQLGADGRVATGLSLLFFSSNFFLWHLGMGHSNFALLALALMLAYYLARSCREGLRGFEKALVALAAWALLSGAFYHVMVYFALPLLAASALVAPIALARSSRESRQRVLRGVLEWGLEASVGVALAAYKWLPILRYQQDHPRSLVGKPEEIPTLAELAMNLGLPTVQGRYLGLVSLDGPYGIHESSVFSLIPWLLLVLLPWAWLRRAKRADRSNRIPTLGFCGWLAVVGMAVALGFCLGDAAPWLPHAWLDSQVFHDSVRVVGRYQLVTVFCMVLLVARIATCVPETADWLARRGLPVCLALSLLNLATFAPMVSVAGLIELARLPRTGASGLGNPVLVPPSFSFLDDSRSNSSMYPQALRGKIILNCYQSLSRQALVAGETGPLVPLQPEAAGEGGPGEYRLVESDGAPAAELHPCLESFFLTQNHLRFDPRACPPGTCVNLNGLNPDDDRGFLVIDPRRRRYCLEPGS